MNTKSKINSEDFHQWFNELKSNSLWWMRMQEMFVRKDLNKIAGQVHLYLLASEQRLKANDFQDFRRLFQSFAQKTEDTPVRPQLQQIEEKKETDWQPVSEEERARRLKEYKALIDSMPMINNFPRLTPKEKEENGEWIPVKHIPYPTTSEKELYVKERHMTYLKHCYEPRTGEKLPGWVSEDEFNLLFENGLL